MLLAILLPNVSRASPVSARLAARLGADTDSVSDAVFLARTSQAWPDTQHAYGWWRIPRDRRALPPCRATTPLLTGDSVGPVRLGMTLGEFRRLCPRFLHLWDYHPERWSPVLAAKLGGSVILAHVTDTTASAVISVVWTGDAATRTRERVGPGSTYKELEAAYGAGHVFSAEECTWTEARFRSAPGLYFVLDHEAGCEDPVEAQVIDSRTRMVFINPTAWARDERVSRRTKFGLTSPAFSDADTLPAAHTCDGAGISPPLTLDGVPQGTKTLILTLEEPAAPVGKRVLWLVYDIPDSIRRLPAGIPKTERPAELGGGVQGRNDRGEIGYGAPCPDSSGSHRYVFRVRPLQRSLPLSPGATKQDVDRAVLTSVGKETAATRIAITQVADLTAVYARRRP